MTFKEMHVKWSVILADRLGPEILTTLDIKGQVLHRVRLHLKVPGWLSDLKCHYDENCIFSIEAIFKHKQVACMRRKILFTIFKYLFLFQRY